MYSVKLNKKKLNLAKKLAKTSSLKLLIDMALDVYIRQARRNLMLELLGTGFIDNTSHQKVPS
jgi:hypothetical protein